MDKENLNSKVDNYSLEELGFDASLRAYLTESELSEESLGRVIAEHKELYRVRTVTGDYYAKVTGKQMFDAKGREDYPAVGDWVVLDSIENEKATIRGILPRKSILKRKHIRKNDAQVIAANIDNAFIVESLDRDYNLNRIERYLVLAEEGNIRSIIVLNKVDLVSEDELILMKEQIKDRFDNVDIILSSTLSEKGLDELGSCIARGKTYCFLGSSGVGKSSLINKLLESNEIKTSEISESTGRGKHTTTSREMYFLTNGGIVIDTPGMREIGLVDVHIGIENIFDEIIHISKNCRFVDCSHTQEPGCAILKALEEKKLDKEMYENYLKIKRESEFYQMSEFEKREKDHKFGKYVKNVLKQKDKYRI